MRHTPRGHTREKCHLCGSSGGDGPGYRFAFRPKDKVCSACQQELKQMRADHGMLRSRVDSGELDATERVREISPHPRTGKGGYKQEERMVAAIRAVTALVGSPAARSYPDRKDTKARLYWTGHDYAGTSYRNMTDAERDTLQELADALLALTESAYEDGRQRGSDLLLSLQHGEIGTAEFEEDRRKV